ncbi:MAG: PIN domain-containing protein [Candidatus Moranbacteria bacterium]|nr:PIN domain-containing protein [Candidatus Moranbacteria bacterium]
MNILIDTHILLWWLKNSSKLKKNQRALIKNQKNCIFISPVSIWEIVIKRSVKKLNADCNEILKNIRLNNFIFIDINFKHVKNIENLPLIHKDPFDRMLISQAIIEDYYLLTDDPNILKYEVKAARV